VPSKSVKEGFGFNIAVATDSVCMPSATAGSWLDDVEVLGKKLQSCTRTSDDQLFFVKKADLSAEKMQIRKLLFTDE